MRRFNIKFSQEVAVTKSIAELLNQTVIVNGLPSQKGTLSYSLTHMPPTCLTTIDGCAPNCISRSVIDLHDVTYIESFQL